MCLLHAQKHILIFLVQKSFKSGSVSKSLALNSCVTDQTQKKINLHVEVACVQCYHSTYQNLFHVAYERGIVFTQQQLSMRRRQRIR